MAKRKVQILSIEEVQKQLVDSYTDFFNSFDEKSLEDKHIVDKDFDLTDDDLSCIRHSTVRE